jgi:hypothetical protein
MAGYKALFFVIPLLLLFSIFSLWFGTNSTDNNPESTALRTEITDWRDKIDSRQLDDADKGWFDSVGDFIGNAFDTVVFVFSFVIGIIKLMFSAEYLFSTVITLTLFLVLIAYVLIEWALPMIRGN